MKLPWLQNVCLVSAVGLLAGCTQETPTEIGGPLLPGTDVRTFEVILEADQFLQNDTAFSGYAQAFDANFLLLARNFEGVVDANTLIRFGRPPGSLQVRDSAGTVRPDTLPRYPTGALVIRIDTARSRGPATLALYRTAENFDAGTATWTVRSDTGGVPELWQTPGGTRGDLLVSAEWQPGVDSLLLALDSAQIAAVTDTAEAARGALITLDQASGPGGSRLRIGGAILRLAARSSIRPDTVIEVNVDVTTATFIFTPDPPTVASAARVSGVPAWRSILTFSDDLRDLRVPCPSLPAPCSLRLGDLHVNLADLLLRPTASPAGFSPEDSIRVVARLSIEGADIPLERSPVADASGCVDLFNRCVSRSAAAPARFVTGDTGPEVAVNVSPIVAAMMADTATAGANRVSRRISLHAVPIEAASFGFGSFLPGARLRLILTVTSEQQR